MLNFSAAVQAGEGFSPIITQPLSLDQMKDSMHASWSAGDFGAIAKETGVPKVERFVARVVVRTWRACAGYRLQCGFRDHPNNPSRRVEITR
jgi:hypothetical protein